MKDPLGSNSCLGQSKKMDTEDEGIMILKMSETVPVTKHYLSENLESWNIVY